MPDECIEREAGTGWQVKGWWQRVSGTDIWENVLFHILQRDEFIHTIVDPRSFFLDKQGQARAGNGGSGPLYQPLSIRSQERSKDMGDGWRNSQVLWVTLAIIPLKCR